MSSIRSLKGVGEKAEELFGKLGVSTVEELLHYYPRSYDIYEAPEAIGGLVITKLVAVEGVIERAPTAKKIKNLQN